PASRTAANASGRTSSTVSPLARRSRRRGVLSASSASERFSQSGSSSLTRATTLRSRRSSASLESRRPPRKLKAGTCSLVDLQREMQPRRGAEHAGRLALVDGAERLSEERGAGEEGGGGGCRGRRAEGAGCAGRGTAVLR